MRVFLVIKGLISDARAQAAQRGIDFTIEATSGLSNEVYGRAPGTDLEKIIRWYAEDAGLGRPALPGELLWYAERK